MLQHRFLHRKASFPNTSRFRFIAGIVIGLLQAFIFYALLYLTREVFRLLSVTEHHQMWTLTESEVWFYNLFFAFIAVIFAQSSCFLIWFERPKKFFREAKLGKATIVNDQRVLNWHFLNWFAKLGVTYAIFFGITMPQGWKDFSLYPQYWYIFILIILVLFLHSWTTIRKKFHGKSLKYMLISAIMVSGLSFALSLFNPVDYKALNNIVLSKNPKQAYKLEAPESAVYERLKKINWIENIYVGIAKKEGNTKKPVIKADGEVLSLRALTEQIKKWQLMRTDRVAAHLIYQLHIHKTVKMRFVQALKAKLTEADANRIAYSVKPENPEDQIAKHLQNIAFPMLIPTYNGPFSELKQSYENYLSIRLNKQHIRLNGSIAKLSR